MDIKLAVSYPFLDTLASQLATHLALCHNLSNFQITTSHENETNEVNEANAANKLNEANEACELVCQLKESTICINSPGGVDYCWTSRDTKDIRLN